MGSEIFKPCCASRLWAGARAVGKPGLRLHRRVGNFLSVETVTQAIRTGAEKQVTIEKGAIGPYQSSVNGQFDR